ncbi:DUF6929 family protein [Rufibacter roseus]|uniref:DUF6929 family protein n=1 Tax=Rufibacter roseus TaxID=1567108 RepID=A0ABW2DKR7_9BACT|nr:hypothetical protein [Rufibacter roseus]
MQRLYALVQFSIFISMTAFFSACQTPSESSPSPPKAVIQEKMTLEGIPSASGIEKIGNRYYVIGDDSPYLFTLDEEFKIVNKTTLTATTSMSQGRIPKPMKPDFEAITSLELEGQHFLFIIGSGSTEKRNIGFLVPVNRTGPGKPIQVPLQELYGQLAKDQKVVGKALLNIEGLAADEEYVYLLQRFAPGGQNVLITYSLHSLTPFLLGRAAAPAPMEIKPFALPELENISTGFSGVTSALRGRLLFTASAEETPNAVLDGEVYGSMVGWIHAHRLPGGPLSNPTVVVPITDKTGMPYKGKIESICILKDTDGLVEAVAVTDSDDGLSELVVLHFTW